MTTAQTGLGMSPVSRVETGTAKTGHVGLGMSPVARVASGAVKVAHVGLGMSEVCRVWVGLSITDTFTRTVADTWGVTTGNTATAWQQTGAGAVPLAYVDGANGVLYVKKYGPPTFDSPGFIVSVGTYLDWTPPTTNPDPPADIKVRFRLSRALWSDGVYNSDSMAFDMGRATGHSGAKVNVYLDPFYGNWFETYDGSWHSTEFDTSGIDLTEWTILRVTFSGVSNDATLWLYNGAWGDAAPDPIAVLTGGYAAGTAHLNRAIRITPGTMAANTWYWPDGVDDYNAYEDWWVYVDSLNVIGSADWT